MERNVLEYVDHLHEHFLYPCSINDKGRYNVPTNPLEGYRYAIVVPDFPDLGNLLTVWRCSIEIHKSSIAEYSWPDGSYWVNAREKAQVSQ